MTPVLIHADGSECHHVGDVAGLVFADGPRCADGQQVTHVLINGTTVTMEQAVIATQQIVAGFRELGRELVEWFEQVTRVVGKP